MYIICKFLQISSGSLFNLHYTKKYCMYILSEMERAGFSKDVCRSMIAMMDWDRSGKLGFEEFKCLWIDIRQWKVKSIETF